MTNVTEIKPKKIATPGTKPSHSARRRHTIKSGRVGENLFDAKRLTELEGTPIYNTVLDAEVIEVKADKIMLSPKNFPGHKIYIPISEASSTPAIGDVVTVYVEDPASGDQPAKASLTKVKELADIEALQKALLEKADVKGIVVGLIKGGFSTQILVNNRNDAELGLGLRAFLPNRNATLYQGDKFKPDITAVYDFQIEDFEPRTGSIIVTRKHTLQAEKKAKQKATWEILQQNALVEGRVKSLTDFGAFIEVDGVDGLLHRTDLSWDAKASPSSLLKVGQHINVKIIELDKDKKTMKLGLKQLTPDPWATIENRFKVGMDVSGTIVAFADFGAFVEIDENVEGLIHLSEMSWKRHKHPSQRFQIGDKVVARVLGIEKGSHRISLSTKALEKSPVEKLEEQYPVGAKIKSKIVGIEDFGVFVALDETVSGLVHIGEISWTERVSHPSELYKVGDEVEFVVLGFDKDRQRVSCSIKRVNADPWADWKHKYAKGTAHKVKVAKITSSGAEVELEPGLLAYCSVRELASEAAERAQDMVKVGQELDVMVTAMEPAKHKIAVSVKALLEHETKEDYDAYLKRQSQEGSSKVTLSDAMDAHQKKPGK